MTKSHIIRKAYQSVIRLLSFAFAVLLLASCERVEVMDGGDDSGKQTVTVSVMEVENMPWQTTRAVGDLCTRLSLALFDYSTGNKVMQIDQTSVDEDFGHFVVQLEQKSYHMVVIGYSTDEAASIDSHEKVTFVKNSVGEVFSYYSAFRVGPNDSSLPVTLKRTSAMFSLEITGNIPSNAFRIVFQFAGASRDLNPKTGLGVSELVGMTVRKLVTEGVNVYSTYMFALENPHTLESVVISAEDNTGTVIRRVTFNNYISVAPNMKTVVKGDFFKTKLSPVVEIDDSWDNTNEYDIPDEDEIGQP